MRQAVAVRIWTLQVVGSRVSSAHASACGDKQDIKCHSQHCLVHLELLSRQGRQQDEQGRKHTCYLADRRHSAADSTVRIILIKAGREGSRMSRVASTHVIWQIGDTVLLTAQSGSS